MPIGFPSRRDRSASKLLPTRKRCGRQGVESLEPRLALSASGLVVTEIMYHAPPPSPAEELAGFSEADFDFVELQNVGPTAIDLTGLKFVQGIEFEFPAGTLEPGAFVVVAADADALAMRYGSTGIFVAGEFSGSLANGGEELVLEDADGVEVFTFEFNDQWHPTTDGDGRSLVIVDPLGTPSQWSEPAGWTASESTLGSPGRPDGPTDSSPPSVPANLVATQTGPMSVALSWQPSSDPESGVSVYRIYRNSYLIGSTAETAYSDPAPANATYTYTVTAVNGTLAVSGPSNEATIALPHVGETPAFAPAQVAGIVRAEGRETSGIAASWRNPGVFWIHDDGEQNEFVAINAAGQVLGTFTLSGASGLDVEDIAVGPGPVSGASYVYLGDIGDNNADRPTVAVIRIREPQVDPAGGDQSQTVFANQYEVISLTLPSGPVDAEALMVDPLSGDLYVLSKEGGTSRLFLAPAASLVGGATVAMTHVASVDFGRPSAADISPTGREILVRDEDRARLFLRGDGQTIAQAMVSTPLVVPVVGTPDEPNGEGIAFDADGNNYYTISEGRDPQLHYFHRTSRSPGSMAALEGDLNGDGRVGLVDLVILQRSIGTLSGATPQQGDLDGNGTVDRADLARLVARFGDSTATVSSAANVTPSSTVPIASEASSPEAAAAPAALRTTARRSVLRYVRFDETASRVTTTTTSRRDRGTLTFNSSSTASSLGSESVDRVFADGDALVASPSRRISR